jgi:HTH-type transcriptional regulator, competence development regulator
MKKFGATIQQLRMAQNLELRETAHLVGVPPVYLSRLERGKEPPPDEAIVRSLAKVLAADPEMLLKLCPTVDGQVNVLLQQRPNIGSLVQLLLDRNLSDEQVYQVERFVRREVLRESSASTV